MADRFKKDWNTTTGLPPWGYLVENVPDHLPTPNTRRTISAPQTAHKTDPERGIYRTRSGSVALGNLGKIVLEWCHLSTLTGDTSYCTLAQQTESLLINSKKPQVAETFPGLLSIFVRDSSYHINSNEKPNPEKSYGFDEIITWSTVGGQYYENLLKMYLYDSAKYAVYKQRYVSLPSNLFDSLTVSV